MNDNELIYLTKTEGLKNARWILNQKYFTYTRNLTKKYSHNLFNRDSYNDYEDMSDAFITLNKCINEFNIKQHDCCFGAKIALTCKSNYLNEIRNANTKKGRLKNNIVEIDKLFNLKQDSCNPIDNLNNAILNSQKLDIIKNFLEREPIRIRRIVYLKLKGVQWHKIAREFRITKRKAQNLWFYFIKKFRKTHGHQIDL